MMRGMQSASASILIEFDKEEDACVIYMALQPEFIPIQTSRCKTDFQLTKNHITLRAETKDNASLRAIINSYYRWVKIAKSLKEV